MQITNLLHLNSLNSPDSLLVIPKDQVRFGMDTSYSRPRLIRPKCQHERHQPHRRRDQALNQGGWKNWAEHEEGVGYFRAVVNRATTKFKKPH
jgi:hypothetical protein